MFLLKKSYFVILFYLQAYVYITYIGVKAATTASTVQPRRVRLSLITTLTSSSFECNWIRQMLHSCQQLLKQDWELFLYSCIHLSNQQQLEVN